MDNSLPIIKSKKQRRREAALRRLVMADDSKDLVSRKSDVNPDKLHFKVQAPAMEGVPAVAPSMSPAQVQTMIDAAVKAALAAVAPPAPAAIQTLSSEELRRLLEIEEARKANEESMRIVVTANPTDTSHLPPVGERRSESIQAPAKKWGDPRWSAIRF